MLPRPFARIPRRWRRALEVDSDLAELEGLAAGTGLLTGQLARSVETAAETCPVCGGTAEPVVIDLVARRVDRRCLSCDHRWARVESVKARPEP